MDLGKNIRTLRKKKKFNQTELANKIGASQKAVSAWEKNKRIPRKDMLNNLCNIFEISPSILFLDNIEKMIKNNRCLESGSGLFHILSIKEIKDYIYAKNKSTTYHSSHTRSLVSANEAKSFQVPSIVMFEIKDDAMSPEFGKGDLVPIELEAPYKRNDVLLFDVLGSDKVVLRRFIIDENFKYQLHANNNIYPVINLWEDYKKYRYIGSANNSAFDLTKRKEDFQDVI
ncbi:MAG: helix-turn-helix domain-containing protein [Candidatus Zapsychrus exili]|nr:helix-turn-helix domain-containing protein [Candidatus Zapsychrus exili]